MSDEEISTESPVMRLKDSPVPFERLAVGAVLSDPMGERFMKIMLGNHFYWTSSTVVLGGSYTDKKMRECVEDDWEVWL